MNAQATPKAEGSLWDASPRPAIERLAKIEGESNFMSILAGIEAGTDTTEDMGALSFARSRGCVPETLEAHVAQTALFKLPLMSVVYMAVISEFNPKEKDLPWVRGAIADAFLLLSRGECKTLGIRAKSFKVRLQDYAAMRALASGVFAEMLDRATRDWLNARKRESETPSKWHTKGGRGEIFEGHVKPSFPDSDDPAADGFNYRPPGIRDRLGWDERNDFPSPVTTL